MSLHYRELTVWRKAMDLAKEVYGLAPMLPREETYGIRSQITRAGTSIPANIAITLCEELNWFPAEKTSALRGLVVEVGKMLSTLRRQAAPPLRFLQPSELHSNQ